MLTVCASPSGVGMGRKPQLWLKDGDVVEVGLEHVGTWYVLIASEYSHPHWIC